MQPGRLQGVLQQAGDGHGTDAAGHRRDPGGPLGHWREVHVAHQVPRRGAVDADIDDDGPLLDPVTLHEVRPTDGGHHQIGIADLAGQVPGTAVADADGAARRQQFQGHGPTDDIGLTDDEGVEALQVAARALQQGHHPLGRAGAQQGHAQGQPTDVVGMEAIHVLGRQDALDDLLLVDVVRQGQLDQDAVDRLPGIEVVNQR